jgi:hypothetical protein
LASSRSGSKLSSLLLRNQRTFGRIAIHRDDVADPRLFAKLPNDTAATGVVDVAHRC